MPKAVSGVSIKKTWFSWSIKLKRWFSICKIRRVRIRFGKVSDEKIKYSFKVIFNNSWLYCTDKKITNCATIVNM